ncbi:stretch-activated cation channel Mid1 [Russula compacta]|nr:stretch-activated cation channel Mid1 [Russula compacta]
MLPLSRCALASPLSLLLSLSQVVRSQDTLSTLSFDTPLTLSGNNFSTTSTPLLFSLPPASQITISLALCDAPSSSPPLVFVTNGSSSQVIPGPSDGPDVFEVTLSSLGLGNFTLEFPAGDTTGGVLAVYGGTTSDSLEIGVSQGATAPLHAPLSDLPFFGDSTANEVLLFSPAFLAPDPAPEPTYPNYTLPQANTTLPDPPSSQPNFTLFLSPLSTGLSALPQTACAVRKVVTSNTTAAQSGQVLTEQPWLRDARGWRTEWLVGGLAPLTNYSVYAIQDDTHLSGPLYFTTKSASFSCQLVHGLPYCPRTAYSVPLPEAPGSAPAYNASNLPENITTPLLSYLTNFTVSLLTVPCGRDAYSPLQTCADCQAAYRSWLCSISFPRCGEFPPQQPPEQQEQQQGTFWVPPPPALVPQPAGMASRNAALGNATANYTELLPCFETCNAADRACPILLGFRCPQAKSTASASYGLGFIDSSDGEVQGGGMPGAAQDQWGNVFCNGS